MNKNSFDGFVAAWNNGNLDTLDEYIAANVVRRVPETMDGTNNLDELKQRITDFRTAFSDMRATIDDAIFTKNRSAAQWTFTGTNTDQANIRPRVDR